MGGCHIIFATAVCVTAVLSYLRLVACAVEAADAAVGCFIAQRPREQ